MRHFFVVVLTCVLTLIGCFLPSEAIALPEPIQIISAEMRTIPDAEPRDDYELVIIFNRPLTNSELTTARFNRATYGLKYEITSHTGWHETSSGIANVQRGLTRDNNFSYWIARESSFNPPGRYSYSKEVDEAFRTGNIATASIELYTQNKQDPDAKWQLIQKFEASNL